MALRKIIKSQKEYNTRRWKKWIQNNKERHKLSKERWRIEHRVYLNAWHKKWREKNKDRLREIEKRRYKKHRVKRCEAARNRARDRRSLIIKTYGNQCVCCGEKRMEFLSIDHVNGGGRKERKNRGIHSFYKSIIDRNFPSEYRILCHNCNQSLGIDGNCQLQNER
jgi:hypothetical protein